MLLSPERHCPRCGVKLTRITKHIGKPTKYGPCGHEDFSIDLLDKTVAAADYALTASSGHDKEKTL